MCILSGFAVFCSTVVAADAAAESDNRGVFTVWKRRLDRTRPMISIRTLIPACFFSLFAVGLLTGAQTRIVAPVDPARAVVLRGHVHPKAQPQFDEGPADSALQIPYATLYLKPAAGLESFLAEQQNPSSANYHRWLTPDQFGERFGLSDVDIAKVKSWLQSQGLKVHDVARGRHWITFSGSAGEVGRAFRVQIHRYRINGEIHFANSAAPAVPAAFEDVVAGVEGLHDFIPQPLHVKAATVTDHPLNNAGRTHYIAPDDLAAIYNLTPLYNNGTDGTGQKVAVIGRASIDLADNRQFRKQFNLAPKDPQLVLIGPEPGTANDDVAEADTDLEWSGAVARNADILYVYSLSVITSAQYAVDENLASVMTYSYGSCELEVGTGFRAVAQQASAQGITWFVGTGDWGAATCDSNAPTPQATKGPTVSFPSTFPEVTAVGGSQFDDGSASDFWSRINTPNGASALGYIPERAWNDSSLTNSLSATGGGASGLYTKPFWQNGPGVPDDHARDVPDVSLAASPNHYGYIVYTSGHQVIYGGTSLSGPAWAGLAALLNQHLSTNAGAHSRLGNINPRLYRLAQTNPEVFHDITTGDNKVPCQQSSPGCVGGLVGFSAGAGYDQATGLGSVDANALVAKWNSGISSLTLLTASSPTVSINDTVQLIATVIGSTAATPNGTVTFVANDATLGSAPLTPSDTGATASLAVPAALVTYGNGTVTALYNGDDIYNSSSGTTTVSLKLPVTGAMVVPFVTPNPVYKNGTANNWIFVVSLTEKAGVAATLTGFTVGSSNALSLFSSKSIPANGTISVALEYMMLSPPVNNVFMFTGTDATGVIWTRQLSVPFLDTPGASLAPAMTLTSPLPSVQRNPQADPSCEWSQPLTVQEQGGFEVTLSSLTVGGISMSGQLQQLFGTQRLAPLGMLQGVMCFPGTTTPTTKSYILSGTSEIGTTVTTSLNTPLVAAPAAAASFAVTHPTMDTVNLVFTGGTPRWTVSISPANRTSGWLTVSPSSGSGDAQLTIETNTAGLSNGDYNAVVTIQAADSIPQSISIPVSFLVGGTSSTNIRGVQNAFSFGQGFAPGMAMSVYGSQLARSILVAPTNQFPLPLVLSGVSAAVNGISAPLYYISPGQINIQVPYETGAGPAVLTVNNNGQVASFPFSVVPAAPGLYASAINNSTGLPVTSAPQGGLLLLFVTGEGDVTPSLATGATPSSSIIDPSKLPHPRMPIEVTIGEVSADVLFAGIPSGVAGLTQIDFTVPAGAPTGPQPVVVTVGGVASPPIILNVTGATGM